MIANVGMELFHGAAETSEGHMYLPACGLGFQTFWYVLETHLNYMITLESLDESCQLLIMIIMPINSSPKIDYDNYDNLYTLVLLQ